MQSITGMEWLKKQIRELETTTSKFKNQIDDIKKIKPQIYNEFEPWTPLKLILLDYSLDVCTKIISGVIKRQNYIFKEMHYVDLFAGSGINKIKHSEDDFFIGSPLISALNHAEFYNSMIFCERDKPYSEALDLRLNTLKKSNITVMKEECERCLDRILEKAKGKQTYSFFFIDPFSMEFGWESMKKVLKARSDIIFNFMTLPIYREVCAGKIRKGSNNKLTEFFGDDSWKKANNREGLVNIYEENILKERQNALIRTIRIQSKKRNFCYHLFFITNKTKGGNQWLRAIDKAKKEIESNSDESVEMALDIVKKRQSELLQFQ